jgi:transaldolase/glucose-6-phosphate isomerase
MSNPLIDVQKHGQSIWYDNIRRGMITSGELHALVENDGVLGVTSNPAIFEKAIAGSNDYDPSLSAYVAQGVGDAQSLFEGVAIQDIQLTADVLRPVYERTKGVDGYVSLEVSPYLANDTDATIEEALRLWKAVGRDNLMIKVPATPEGLPCIEALIAEGLNINVTLLFGVDAYEAVHEAYISGLEKRLAAGGDLTHVASVASFFVSRIDAVVDGMIGQELESAKDPARRAQLEGMLGKVAIANAKISYESYLQTTASKRWKRLAAAGAMPQRVLWASTGTKNPEYSKCLYVDELIGADTVNTVPADTFQAFKVQGVVSDALGADRSASIAEAREIMSTLAQTGISIKEVTDQLLTKGVQAFADAFDQLLGAVEEKRRSLIGNELAQQSFELGDAHEKVELAVDLWRREGRVRRLWARDASLFSGADEAQWLGWLDAVASWSDGMESLEAVAAAARSGGFRHAVVLGMGGSSLCPDLLGRTFGAQQGSPELLVLDSTNAAQIRSLEARIDPARTLFIVASKSGGTIEPNAFKAYFYDQVEAALGKGKAGANFVAITDPGSSLEAVATAEDFLQIAYGDPSIGGRFSALSSFGMLPAAVMGLDVASFVQRAGAMVHSCASCVPPAQNPGALLGLTLGTLAQQGRNKLTLVASPELASLGGWIEQLVAESTGKGGIGIVPVDGEELAGPEAYGADRLFVQIALEGSADAGQDSALKALEAAGHPVVRIALGDTMDLGQEFFRWEIATAVAGAVLGINPFDQPDVEAAKGAARSLMQRFEEKGELPGATPIASEGGLELYADEQNAAAVGGGELTAMLQAHLARLGDGDYFALNAYVEMSPANDAELQALRHAVRDAKGVATTLGYGPRFLHSTGQLHKGGPNSGVFLQITGDSEDLAIPGQPFSFGVLEAAQAQGDLEVLFERGRRALRVHLGSDVAGGLAKLRALVEGALSA